MAVATAKVRHLRMTPRKVRFVADLVRGLSAQDALDQLKFNARLAARPIYKLVHSAVSNADQKGGIDVDTLFISKIFVDEGPTLKRFMPRARGRADRLLKRTSHVTLELDQMKG
jgi:large subunit ribosomal protein L22